MGKKRKRKAVRAYEFEFVGGFGQKLEKAELKRRLAGKQEVLEAFGQLLFMEKALAEQDSVDAAMGERSSAVHLGRVEAVRNMLSELQHLMTGQLSEPAKAFFV